MIDISPIWVWKSWSWILIFSLTVWPQVIHLFSRSHLSFICKMRSSQCCLPIWWQRFAVTTDMKMLQKLQCSVQSMISAVSSPLLPPPLKPGLLLVRWTHYGIWKMLCLSHANKQPCRAQQGELLTWSFLCGVSFTSLLQMKGLSMGIMIVWKMDTTSPLVSLVNPWGWMYVKTTVP